jgi:hypothetical protein
MKLQPWDLAAGAAAAGTCELFRSSTSSPGALLLEPFARWFPPSGPLVLLRAMNRALLIARSVNR